MSATETALPDCFIGAWARVGLSIDGGPEEENADVLWLQSATWFADRRIDRATGRPVACFAGYTTWDPPTLRWHRLIDLNPEQCEDVGHVDWEDGDLIETGVFPFPGTGGPVPYLERWRRLPDDRPVHAVAAADRIAITAGVHRLEVSAP